MSYTTPADLIARYHAAALSDLTDRDQSVGGVNMAVLADAIDRAQARIDAALAARYQTPVAPVPLMLTQIAQVIVFAELYTEARPDQVQRDYDQALRDLTALSLGRLVLPGVPPATDDPAAVGGLVQMEGDHAGTFSRQNTGGW